MQATRPQSYPNSNPNRGIRQISPALAAELGGCISISTRFDSITLTIISLNFEFLSSIKVLSPNSEFLSSIKVGNVEAI